MKTRPLNQCVYKSEILLVTSADSDGQDGSYTTSSSQQDISDLIMASAEFMDISSWKKTSKYIVSRGKIVEEHSEDKRVPVVKIFSPESSALRWDVSNWGSFLSLSPLKQYPVVGRK